MPARTGDHGTSASRRSLARISSAFVVLAAAGALLAPAVQPAAAFAPNASSEGTGQLPRAATIAINATDPAPPFQFPGGRGADQLIVYTPAFSQPTTGTNQYGIEAVATREGTGYRVTTVGGNNSAVPADGIVISGHGTAQSWILANVGPGALLTVNGQVLTSTTDATSQIYTGQQAVDTATSALAAARASYADAPLDEAAGTLSQARDQLDAARSALAGGNQDLAAQQADRAAATATTARQYTVESRAMESRAAWHRPTETSPAQVDATVKAMHDAGLNQLYLETFWGGTTIYPSRIAEQNPAFAGWDPLAAFTAAAHRYGIELHLWMHTFFVGYDAEGGPGPVVRDHPDWLVKDRSGAVRSSTEPGYYFLDPSVPDARRWLIDLFTESVNEYHVTGLQLDYIRYPSQGTGLGQTSSYNDLARAAFRGKYGADPLGLTPADALWTTWQDWETANVSSFVHDVRAALPAGTVLSSALESADNAANIAKFHQDFAGWVDDGLLQVAVPEVYTTGVQDVAQQAAAYVGQVGTRAFAPIGLAPSYLGAPPDTEVGEVVAARAAGSTGQSHFVWKSLTPDYQAALARSVYRLPAKDPQADPVGASAYEAADMLRRISTTYAAGLTPSVRLKLSVAVGLLHRDLAGDRPAKAAQDIRRFREALTTLNAPAPVTAHLRTDIAEIVQVLDTAQPSGWSAT